MTVMVFGVFDGLHEGHKAFLRDARTYGDLVIVVARDETVAQLKRKTPQWHQLKRVEILKDFMPDARIVLGDILQGRYDVVRSYHPDAIGIGYDQNALHDDLRQKMADGIISKIPLLRIRPHEPERYNSTRLAGDQSDHRSA